MMFCKIMGMVVDKKQTTDSREVFPCVVSSALNLTTSNSDSQALEIADH